MKKAMWRTFINDIDPYIPGKSIEDVKKDYQLENVIRLASNENQHGPSPKVMEVVKQSVDKLNFYPESTGKALREKLANYYGISVDEVMTANGAENILTLLISTYVNEGDEVVYGTPTFPAYRATTQLMGGVPVEVPLTDDWCFDLDGLLEHITEKTKLVFICNPNNPTGTIVSKQSLTSFLDKVPDHVQVIIDEAYIEYVDEKDYLTGIDLYKQSYPVVIVRTFSKFYGLAGLRIGYAIATEQVLEPVLRIREPFTMNRIAIEAAIVALDAMNHGREHLENIKEGKQYLTEKLKAFGYETIPSHTNFLFVDLKNVSSVTLFERLLPHGVIIRPCAPWGYTNFARISIGTRKQNEFLVKTLQSVTSELCHSNSY